MGEGRVRMERVRMGREERQGLFSSLGLSGFLSVAVTTGTVDTSYSALYTVHCTVCTLYSIVCIVYTIQ